MAINEKMKWPTDKDKYDANYLRIFGDKCSHCGGTGGGAANGWMYACSRCHGVGFVEKRRKR